MKSNATKAVPEKAAEKPLERTAETPNPVCGKQRGYFVCNERPNHKGGHKTWESGRIVFAWPR